MAGVSAFLLASLGLLYYALRGDSYDLVVRQEEAIVVAGVLGLGCLLALLPRARLPRGWWLPVAALAALAGWTALSLAWSSSDERTFAELARALHYLGLLLLVLFLAGRGLWRPAVIGLTATGVAVCGLALAGRLFPSVVPTNEVASLFRSDRLNYPLNYWNALSAWSAMTMTMLLALSAHTVRPVLRSLVLAAVPICALAAYLTYSRQGIAGIALGVVLVIGLGRARWLTATHALIAGGAASLPIFSASRHDQIANATGTEGRATVLIVLVAAMALCAAGALIAAKLEIERWRVSRQTSRAALGGAAIVALVLVATVGRHPISNAWHDFKKPVTSQTGAARYTSLSGHRYEYWRSAWKAFKAHPADGTGAGTFEFWWNRHGGQEFVRDAHSLYIENAAELGVPGFLLVVAFTAALAALALRPRRSLALPAEVGAHVAAAAAFLVYLLHAAIDWMWESTGVSVFAIACAGLAASAGPAAPVRWRIPPRLVVLAAAAIICAVQVPGLLSTSRVRESSKAAAHGDLAKAASDADRAVSAQTWAATPYAQRALVEEARGDLRNAIADTRRAIDRERLDWRHWVLLTRLEAEAGNPTAATHAYRRAASLRPASAFFRFFAPR
ncbi:MAG: O-antigen ligase family protein [Thermoleophilaceae bacterium]